MTDSRPANNRTVCASVTERCAALDIRLAEEANARVKGFVLVVVTSGGDDAKSRVAGVCYRTSASDRGRMLEYCPFCGGGLNDEVAGVVWEFWPRKCRYYRTETVNDVRYELRTYASGQWEVLRLPGRADSPATSVAEGTVELPPFPLPPEVARAALAAVERLREGAAQELPTGGTDGQ